MVMHAQVEDVDGQTTADRLLMEMALEVARRGAAAGEVPVGALLARGTEILGAAHNAPLGLMDPTAHAEVLALRAGARHKGNYRLPGTTLYVTVEPCVMCVGALMQARVERVVFGCVEPKAGALGSVFDIGRDGRGNHRLQVTGGVCAEAASALMRRFFEVRRGA